ncbi:MAG: 7,8-didemethyl-8-hydroxy-5-deazariboflavin synthase subunit CofG, partial [Cyanobacteria bacterium J06648_11]
FIPSLEAGATDLGGIGPVDVVNPDYPHPTLSQLREHLAPAYELRQRLPLYPQHFEWVDASLQGAIARWQHEISVR